MKHEDKQKIKDAFNRVVARDPEGAEQIVDGMVETATGNPITRRRLFELTVQDEGFYGKMDEIIATGQKSLEQFVSEIDRITFPKATPAAKQDAQKPPQP